MMMLGKTPHNFYVIFLVEEIFTRGISIKGISLRIVPIKRRNLFNTTETENIEYLLKYHWKEVMLSFIIFCLSLYKHKNIKVNKIEKKKKKQFKKNK